MYAHLTVNGHAAENIFQTRFPAQDVWQICDTWWVLCLNVLKFETEAYYYDE